MWKEELQTWEENVTRRRKGRKEERTNETNRKEGEKGGEDEEKES